MRVFVFLFVIGLLFGCAGMEKKAAAEEITWYKLSEGKELAKEQKKPMMVDFYYSGECPRCRLMDEAYANPEIARKLNADFIPIRIELSSAISKEEDELGQKYGYGHDCLLVFLDSNGDVIEEAGERLCFVQPVDEKWFLEHLDLVKEKNREKSSS